jgi:hypothetical protein
MGGFVRVIARFPDVSGGAVTAAAVPAPAVTPAVSPAPASSPGPRQARRPKRPSLFPSWSVAALAVMAAAVWVCVAIGEREAARKRAGEHRLAAEPPRLGPATEAVSR